MLTITTSWLKNGLMEEIPAAVSSLPTIEMLKKEPNLGWPLLADSCVSLPNLIADQFSIHLLVPNIEMLKNEPNLFK